MQRKTKPHILIFLSVVIVTSFTNGCTIEHTYVPASPSQSKSRVYAPTLLEIAISTYGLSLSPEGKILIEQVGKGNKAVFDESHNHLDAHYIQFLCHPTVAHLIPPRGIGIEGASIKGKLALTGFNIDFPLWIKNSTFDDLIEIQSTKLRGLYMYGNHIASIRTVDVEVDNSLHIKNNCIVEGSADFNYIIIKGDLDCRSSRFLGSDSFSLNFFGSHISGNAHMGANFSVARGISFAVSRIGGSLILYDGKNLISSGTLSLNGAHIGGDLEIVGTEILDDTVDAIDAQGLQVGGRLILHDVNLIGKIDLGNATINGGLYCRDSNMHVSSGSSLILRQGHFESSVSIVATEMHGTVDLLGASVGSELIFDKVTFHNGTEDSLICPGAKGRG